MQLVSPLILQGMFFIERNTLCEMRHSADLHMLVCAHMCVQEYFNWASGRTACKLLILDSLLSYPLQNFLAVLLHPSHSFICYIMFRGCTRSRW